MKKVRRIIATMMTMMLVLSMGVAVSATTVSGQTYSITIESGESGHTYEAYQIFSGTLSEDGSTLSDIQWGTGVTEAGQEVLGSAAAYADSLAAGTVTAEAAAQELSAYLASPTAETADSDEAGNYVLSGLPAGYYLVKDKDGSLSGTGTTYTSYILQVVKDVTTAPKADVPSVSKWVKDINDSTETELSDWQKSADHDLGDSVPFRLVATMPSNIADYESYALIFHDTLSAGLTYADADAFTVTINGTEVEGFTKKVEANADGSESITFACRNIKALGQTIDKDTVVAVEYNAVLNENAVIGAEGNPNVVYLEFSNNPNASGSGQNGEGGNEGNGGNEGDEGDEGDWGETGQTPEDKVIVFTYEVVLNKVDGDGNPLAGAAFTLYKVLESGEQQTIDRVVLSNDDTTFTFSRIDDGEYVLKETTTPNGYNSIPDVTFTVVAGHQPDALTLDSLTATQTSDGDTILEFGGDTAAGTLSTNVVNYSGAVLPSTGGTGTVLIYVVGVVLVLGAAIFLIARKRASK